MKTVELVGKLGEHIRNVPIPTSNPDIIACGSQHFYRDEGTFWQGTKYIEASYLRIELRNENSTGQPPDGIERRKAASR